ncbi:MAG: RecX family transcriptional regulator [Anaerolineae bacterium]|nr:RecX family transcriptional regulator [Anaerolineae bacterium]
MSPRITRLRFQKKNPDRVNVYLDGAYAFSLPAVEAARLRKGQVLTDEEVQALQDLGAFQRAYDQALRFLSYRPRSEREIRQYLQRKGEPEGRIEAIVARLKERQWLDDAAFARFWVENRRSFRPRGRRALRWELRQKGVDEAIIEAALADVDSEAEAADLALRQAARWKGLDYRTFRQRMLGYLTRRGFDYAEAAEATRRAWEAVGGEGQPEEA